MITFKNVKLNINNMDILNDVSFELPDNEILCIVGNKHSGKSSLFKLLTGVYRKYYGEIYYNGVDINDLKTLDIDILHETREKDPDINVNEYLKFYGSLYKKMDKETLDKYIDRMLKKFSLMSYKYTDINTLDHENYKMLELIRISINDPKVILFDNLFSSENSDFNENLIEYIKTLIGKKTLIFATRNLNHIEDLATYIAVIDAGSIVAYGKKEDVYKMAELSNKIEIEVIDKMPEAIEILKKEENISSIVYNDKMISFSIVSNITYSDKRNQVEAEVLKKLVDSGIKVYSFKKQRVRFEQLFGRIKG